MYTNRAMRDLIDALKTNQEKWYSNWYWSEYAPVPSAQEHAGTYIIKAEIPGFNKSEIDVTYNPTTCTLTIDAETRQPDSIDMTNRKYNTEVNLPKSIIAAKTKTHLENGILTLVIPLADNAQSTKIKIE